MVAGKCQKGAGKAKPVQLTGCELLFPRQANKTNPPPKDVPVTWTRYGRGPVKIIMVEFNTHK